MGITESIMNLAIRIIDATGYPGVGLLMTFESMVLPVPSEAVMPFAGFLWYAGTFTLAGVIIASTLGSILGSLISYYIGMYGGRLFVKRFGRYLLLNEEHLTKTERFFARYGEKAVFISRFIPVVRHLISIPAGIGRMRFGKFILYTTIGAAIWNTFLAYVGYLLAERWETLRRYTEVLDIVFVLAILAAIFYFFYKRFQAVKK